MGMGYIGSYERLDDAFEYTQQSEVARLSDIFLPNDEMPDLSLSVGRKLEQHQSFELVASDVGTVVVTHTCRIIRFDSYKLADTIDPIILQTKNGQPVPTHYLRQSVRWTESGGDEPFEHATRIFRGFTLQEMQSWDEESEQYDQACAQWRKQHRVPKDAVLPEPSLENDVPVSPDAMVTVVRTDLSRPHMDDIDKHAEKLAQIGDTHPELAILADFREHWGREINSAYTPEQFGHMLDWLIGPGAPQRLRRDGPVRAIGRRGGRVLRKAADAIEAVDGLAIILDIFS